MHLDRFVRLVMKGALDSDNQLKLSFGILPISVIYYVLKIEIFHCFTESWKLLT